MIVLRGAVFLALGALLDPCSKLGIHADKAAESAPVSTTLAAPAPAASPEQISLEEAKKLCADGDCLTAHDRIQIALPPNSPLRQTADFKSLENRWAQSAVTGAESDPDPTGRRKALEDVMSSPVVDATYKTQARDALPKVVALQAQLADAGAASATSESGASGDSKSKDRGGHRHHGVPPKGGKEDK